VYGLLQEEGDPQPPLITAVTNSASYETAAVSPGELISIFGASLGPAAPVGAHLNPSGGVSTSVAGVQVLIDGIAAPLLLVSQTQVNAVVPFGVSSNPAQVQVFYQDLQSDAFSMAVQAATPGLFSANGSGHGQALAINQDGSINGADHTADPGSAIVLYATGAGQTLPAAQDGAIASAGQPLKPVLPVTVEIGGLPAEVLYAASAPGFVAGLLQINVLVPSGVTPGALVPVVMRTGDQSSQSKLTIAVGSQEPSIRSRPLP
jgi:uncharacterized protein (TIGR03437 family)